jgi:Anticodon-binding domain of tRNA ligase
MLLLSPMAPHFAEELWRVLGHSGSLADESWPAYDPELLQDHEIEVPVQVNGKLRARVTVSAVADRGDIEAAGWADPKIAAVLQGKTLKKVVVVPGKLVNFVVDGRGETAKVSPTKKGDTAFFIVTMKALCPFRAPCQDGHATARLRRRSQEPMPQIPPAKRAIVIVEGSGTAATNELGPEESPGVLTTKSW